MARAPGDQVCSGRVARYPDASDTKLREAIAARTRWPADTIIRGNGSEDPISAICRAVIRSGDHVVTICPSFGLHEFGALAFGATVGTVPFPPDWRFPVDELLAVLAKPMRILIFSSPSNPAGPAVTSAEPDRLREAVPQGTLVMFDEACRGYPSGDHAFDALAVPGKAQLPWISLRTF